MKLVFQCELSTPTNISNKVKWRYPFNTGYYLDVDENKEGYRSNFIGVKSPIIYAVIKGNFINTDLHSDLEGNVILHRYKEGTELEPITMIRKAKGNNGSEENFNIMTAYVGDCDMISIHIKCNISSFYLYENLS